MSKLYVKKIIIAIIALIIVVGVAYTCACVVERIIYPRGYRELVERYSLEFSVPEYVVYSVIKVESGFDEGAVSERGACGLMQLMPSAYGWLKEMRDEGKGNIFDPEENIKYGTYYLSVLYKKYNNWTYALCAYNAGMGNVDKWLMGESFSIPFAETKNYVNKLDVAMGKYKSLYYE